MKLEFVTGDATAPRGEGPKIITHVCNDIGGWGRGFVLALSKKWPEPEASYRAWAASGVDFALGQVQFVEVEPNLTVANLIGQRDVVTENGVPPVRYEAIRKGLQQVANRANAQQASVHMPRMGAGLAGGNWNEIEKIVREELVDQGIPVTVYDLA